MNVILFGLGPHAKRIYLKYLSQQANLEKLIVVDLKSKELPLKALLQNNHVEHELILFDTSCRNSERLTSEQRQTLTNTIKKYHITKAIISTEPRSHLVYLNYCLDMGLDIMCDKPITSPLYVHSEYGVNKILEDYQSLALKYENSATEMFEIQTQRRSHKGYQFIYDRVEAIVKEFHVPVTKIKINHCDGNWNMPSEVIYRENHPYKYGYGKLMHSGYHFIDLLIYFMEINKKFGFDYAKKEVLISDYRPDDFYTYFGKEFNKNLGFQENDDIYENIDLMKNFGELDISSIITFKDKLNKVVTTALLDLSQSGFSRRSWFDLPEDTYKRNGRVRHESFEITVGPLLNIKVLSFQSTEINNEPKFGKNAGDLDHFEIQIYNNSEITGRKPFEKFHLSDLEDRINPDIEYFGQNEQARMNSLNDFFYNNKSHSNILSHKETISILHEMESQLSRRYHSDNFRFSVEAIIEFRGKYLICKRKSTAKVAPGIWNIPAGKVKYFEGIEEALLREIKEETNLEISAPEYLSYHFINKKDKRIVYTYYARVDDINKLIVDESEFDSYDWVSSDQTSGYETLAQYIKTGIKEISERR